MKMPINKKWFEKRAAAEGDNDATTGRRKTMTINLTDEEVAELERLVRPATRHWRCFHCDEVFYDEHAAKLHFGMDQCNDPACKIKMGAEGSLVTALRRAEAELADAWAAILNESTEAAKAYYAQQSRHGEQLRAAEELGYERGLADGRAENSSPQPNMHAPSENTFQLHALVRKRSGAWWEGRVVGFYSTEQTPDGVCVQLDRPMGPVQIYPASALELVTEATNNA